jgi:hypothetical protein
MPDADVLLLEVMPANLVATKAVPYVEPVASSDTPDLTGKHPQTAAAQHGWKQ